MVGRMKNHVQIRCAMLLVLVLLLAASPLAAAQWTQTDWSGGSGQLMWSDPTKYYDSDNVDVSDGENIKLGQTGAAENIATHLVIAEVQTDSIDGTGGTADDWVEIYNPTGSDIDLATTGNSFRIYRDASADGGAATEAVTVDGTSDGTYPGGTTISAYGYYLILDNDATDATLRDLADMLVTDADFSLADDDTIYIGFDVISDENDPDIIDFVSWGLATVAEGDPIGNPSDGGSIERKSSAAGVTGDGSGYDTDNNANDFIQQANDNPENHTYTESPPAAAYFKNAYLESSVFDAGANADWKAVSWNENVPAQTDENVYLRSGSDNNPDDGWSGWYLHDNNSENTSLPNNRYVQYRIQLSTDNENRTPEFLDITINYNAFLISASPSSATVVLGSSSSTTLTLKLLAGTVGSVSLSGSWVGASTPTGVTGSFNPSSVTPTAAGETSTLTFTADSNATTGSYTYRVSGTSGGLTQTLDIPVAVAAFDYSVTAFPDNLGMVRGETKTSTIRVSQVSGTPGLVSLSGAWVGYAAGAGPTGITATSPSPTSGTPSFDSTLTISVGTNAEGGSFLYRVTATGGGVTREANVRVTVNVGLTLTLTTKLGGVVENNFQRGQTITIYSDDVKDPKGRLVENGWADIQLLDNLENLIWQDNVQIVNGKFSDNYQISYYDPEGGWTVKVEARDNLNNTIEVTIEIWVGTPPHIIKYTTSIQVTTGFIYSRGGRIEIRVEVKDDGTPVENLDYIYLQLPSGKRISMRMLSPGVYVVEHTLGWDEPTGTRLIWIQGEKEKIALDNTYVQINTAALQLSLLSPVNRVEVGETAEIKVKASYPNGDSAKEAVVTVTTPAGENLTLVHKGSGIYSATYTVTSGDVGSWGLSIAASDLYGNSGFQTSSIEVASMGAGRVVTTYWWAFLAMFAAVGVASAYITRRTILVRKLKGVRKEMREIPKLKKEAMIKYFKEGSIERDTYDEMMDKHDMRLGELRKQEELLSAKVGKKIKAKKAREKKKRR